MKKILIISAHADDESFGMGGTLKKFQDEGYELHWLIFTKVWEPKWSKDILNERKIAIENIKKQLSINTIEQWEFLDNRLDIIPIDELQSRLIISFEKVRPEWVFVPSPWDFNHEHEIVFNIVQMSTKPYYSSYIEKIIAYEIPSSTDSTFKTFKQFPFNLYINIEKYIESKVELIKNYKSELMEFPHPRSIEYVKSLAKVRGAESGLLYAEGFHILREIQK